MNSPRSILDDPEHWRRCAEDARHVAKQLDDPAMKTAMLRIAKDYERIAEQIELRTHGPQPRS
jgi:hypothetical protein